MAKVNIDLEKLLCSIFKAKICPQIYINGEDVAIVAYSAITEALKDQGIEYKDGSLHYIGEEEVKKAIKEVCENIVGESEPSIIKKGKWYKLIKPIGGLSTVGKIYYACYDGRLLLDNGMVCDVEEVSDHFQLVTEVEIKEVEKPSTIKFNEPDNKKHKFVDLNKSESIPITRMLWRLYTSSHSDSSHQHSEELLLSLLTKGYQKCQEELRQAQSNSCSYTDSHLFSNFEHDVKVLQEDLKYILGVNWSPE